MVFSLQDIWPNFCTHFHLPTHATCTGNLITDLTTQMVCGAEYKLQSSSSSSFLLLSWALCCFLLSFWHRGVTGHITAYCGMKADTTLRNLMKSTCFCWFSALQNSAYTEECSWNLPSPGTNCMTHHKALAAAAATKIVHTQCDCVWHYVKYLLFSDEAWINLHEVLSSENNPYWSLVNPQNSSLWRKRWHMPTFYAETISSDKYMRLILTEFFAQLTEEEWPHACFQQDPTTTHTTDDSPMALEGVINLLI
jgi:hypothetical protein